MSTGPCDDSNDCTKDDQCVAGQCSGEFYSCDDSLDCTLDTCLGDGECIHQIEDGHCLIDEACYVGNESAPGSFDCLQCKPATDKEEWTSALEGKACDDGDACTPVDSCQQGNCVGDATDCADVLECTDDSCDPQTGECVNARQADWCVIDGQCYAVDETAPGPDGECSICDPYGSPEAWFHYAEDLACEDGLECTDAKCVDGLCTEIGLNCDDEDPCTLDDVCQTGVCVGEAKDCAAAAGGDPCLKGLCDPLSEPEPGTCVPVPIEDGEECDDGFFCTADDQCTNGACAGVPAVCPEEVCMTASCVEEQGGCILETDPAQEGDLCEDGKVCSFDTFCQPNGSCGGGWLQSGDDCKEALGNQSQCMVGECVEPDGCQLTGLVNGTPCELDNATAECDKTVCELVECNDGFDNCNDNDEDGCESEVLEDPDNCGECLKKCEFGNAVAGCEDGNCVIGECEEGFGNCDGLDETGCNLATSDNVDHCGGCDQPCKMDDKFANALVSCSDSKCHFQGCIFGFKDTDEDCADGGACTTGCEECQPLVFGGIEIPDDGVDNDCSGGDTVNDEVRGFYVDPGFTFGGGCTDPGLGTRACPYKELLFALFESQFNQPWEPLPAVRREIYIAGGDIVDVGLIADIQHPIMLLGGYIRTGAGPWERDVENVVTRLKVPDGEVVNGGSPTDEFAVLDGLTLSKIIRVKGHMLLSRISSSAQDPIGVYGSVGAHDKAWIVQSHIHGSVASADPDSGGWQIHHCTVTGTVTFNHGWYLRIYNSTVLGNVQSEPAQYVSGGSDWTIKYNTISGRVQGCQTGGWILEENTIGGNINDDCWYSSHGGSNWTLRANHVAGPARIGHYSVLHDNVFDAEVKLYAPLDMHANVVQGDLTMDGVGTCAGNLVVGQVLTANSDGSTFVNNTIYVPKGSTGAAATLGKEGKWINNVIIWKGYTSQTYYGLMENHASNSDGVMVLNNAFIGFGEELGVIYLNENTTPLTTALKLNMLSELPACGRGGNVAYDTIEEAGFVATKNGEPGFLKPAAGSPLIEAGYELPILCDGMEVLEPATDLNGNELPCDSDYHMGCYEYCE